ncbi:hypothetical protein Ade02nite_59320 [Paractinoplanes deccanensis]|uniref:Uncharacterized protein n=1 Tax=Paractinoplanes deccanensis TaxID=113561 RepID=A0ABQ3YBE7_9ACTN|nr:hypothetical protein Ade02nite_59320 [Actinoplanes deccanensis]
MKHKKVARVTRRHHLRGLRLRRRTVTTIADHLRTEPVVDALHPAVRTRVSLVGAIFHSDHGAQGGRAPSVDEQDLRLAGGRSVRQVPLRCQELTRAPRDGPPGPGC